VGARRVDLDSLSVRDIETIVDVIRPSELPAGEDLAKALMAATGGNPTLVWHALRRESGSDSVAATPA
jgi:hypothetical protein